MAKASGDRGFGGYVVALLANQALYLGLHRQVIPELGQFSAHLSAGGWVR